jgi:hypothetical protein
MSSDAEGLPSIFPTPHRLTNYGAPHPLHILTSSRASSFSITTTPESLNDFLDWYADEEPESRESIAIDQILEPLKSPESIQPSNIPDNDLNFQGCSPILSQTSHKNSPSCKKDYTSTINLSIRNIQLDTDIADQTSPTENSGANQSALSSHRISSNFIKKNSNSNSIDDDINDTNGEHESFTNNTIFTNDVFNTTMNSTNIAPNTYTYQFNDNDDYNYDIDESILTMIDKLGNDLNFNDELQIDLIPDSPNMNLFSNENSRLKNRGSINNDNRSLDLLSLKLSSDDEDYNDSERFKSFFNLSDDFLSTKSQAQNVTDEEDNTVISNNNQNLLPSDNRESILVQNLNISSLPLFSESDENEIRFPSDDPPPYTEFDEIQIDKSKDNVLNLKNVNFETNDTNGINGNTVKKSKVSSSNTTNEILITESPKKSIHSQNVSSPSPNSKLRKRISIKLKKNSNGELSKHTNVDYYQMDKYLPPYRSLINPNKVYDYRTKSYIDTNNNDIEIKADSNNKTMVAIYKKKRDSKFMSILLTTNNSIKQKLIDASDTLSIKSRNVSIKSFSSVQQSVSSEVLKYKATAKFVDLSDSIQRLIISFIDNQKDLVNCLYVSKSFNNFTVPVLYKYPKFTSTYRLGQFVHAIMNNESLPKYVKVFDLSKITLPVNLTEYEKLKYQDKLVYGSSTARDVLSDKNKIIYAGWRDWKYRNHPLYGDFNKWRRRANSSSTISSGSTLVQMDSGLGKINNLSATNLMEAKKFKSASSVTLVNNNRTRSRSNSTTTTEKPKKGSSNKGSRTRSNSTNTNGSNDNKDMMKSLKKAFGIESNNMPIKKKSDTSPTRKDLIKSATYSTIPSMKSKSKTNHKVNKKAPCENRKRVSISIPVNNENAPFGTPHPKMNSMLKQYCFNRDVPVGYIIHILKECKNLEELNFNGIIVSPDYQLLDYESFDWFLGNGKPLSYKKPPTVIDENRPIFWSDTGRDLHLNDETFINGFAISVEFKNIWKLIMNVPSIKTLKLSKINWLEQSIISNFVMNSEFKDNLKYLDCSLSGMIKREEWNLLKEANDWKDYFHSQSV